MTHGPFALKMNKHFTHTPFTIPENPSVAIFCRIECTHTARRDSVPQAVSSTPYFHSL